MGLVLRPRRSVAPRPSVERDLGEIAAVLELVRSRAATRVILAGLMTPERAAARAADLARHAGVRVRLERDLSSGSVSVVVGPAGE